MKFSLVCPKGFRYACTLLLLTAFSSVECAHYFRRAATVLGGAIYWGFSLAAPMIEGYFYNNRLQLEAEFNTQPLPEKYPLLNQYAQEELTRLGLPEVRVMPDEHSYALSKHIAIDSFEMDSAEAALSRIQKFQESEIQPDQFSPEKFMKCIKASNTIKRFKGTLHHEANHIKHNDTYRSFAVAVGAACLPLGVGALYRSVRAAHTCAKKLPNVRRALHGIVNGLVSTELLFTGHRVIEQQADDAVCDQDAIVGLSQSLQVMDDDYKYYRNKYPLKVFFFENACTHPSPSSRIKKLQSRITL